MSPSPVRPFERWDPDGSGLWIHSLHWPGPGPRVVAVHGMVVAGRSMAGLAGHLAGAGFEVLVPDLPGFGLSTRPRQVLAVDGLADALAGWLGQVGGGGSSLLGNSFGTQVAAAVAQRHPSLADRLVLLSPTIDARWRAWVPRWLRAVRPAADAGPERPGDTALRRALLAPSSPAGRPEPELGRLIRTEYALAGPRRIVVTYRAAIADVIDERLPGLDVPVAVLRGEDDGLVSEEWARRLAASARRGWFSTVAGADHDSVCRDPQPVARAVARALSFDSDGEGLR